MNSSLVSIIVATYRQDVRLKSALHSLLEQTYTHIEIIVVDDNSDTIWNTTVEDIISSFSEYNNYNQIRYIQNPKNMGSARTRNIGISESLGEYVTFLDDDDIYLPEKIAHQIRYMQETHVDYSITDLRLVNEDGKQIEHRKRSYLLNATPEEYLALHFMYHISGTDTLMFKKKFLQSIGGFPLIDLGDEFYLILNAILAGGSLGYLPVCLVTASVHSGESGLSSGQSKLKCENDLYAKKKLYFYRLKPKEIRLIKMRHFAVLAFAEMRMKHWFKFFGNGVLSFLSSPWGCIQLLNNRVRNE